MFGIRVLVPILVLGSWVAAQPVGAALTERVSVSSTGEQANWHSYYPAISADGRFVAFSSDATNLVRDDTNGKADVFVRDRLLGTTERVSVSSDEEQGNNHSAFYGHSIAISADGTLVVFDSFASNLVTGDTNGYPDIFVPDRVAGTTERLSVSSTGEEASGGWCEQPSVSADGSFVAFASHADNLVPGDTNGHEDVFVRDRLTQTTERVSISTAGDQGTGAGIPDSWQPSISADGQVVAFMSFAENLVPGDTNNDGDVFVRDREAHTTERVSVSTAGDQANGLSQFPSISADGRLVAFESSATNLLPGDYSIAGDVFVYDRHLRVLEPISVSTCGEHPPVEQSRRPSISAGGRFIAFTTTASFVPDDGILCPRRPTVRGVRYTCSR
jgi:Tol biopolymer transport system component